MQPFKDGKFHNEDPCAPLCRIRDLLSWRLAAAPFQKLGYDLSTVCGYPGPVAPGDVRVIWIGHATALIETSDSAIITDPIFSRRCSPFRWFGPSRHTAAATCADDLPKLDAVLISHAHYDHLDRTSIRALNHRRRGSAVKAHYLCPMRLSRTLRRFRSRNVKELDWWQSHEVAGWQITAVPAQHQSQRLSLPVNTTGWCGYWLRHIETGFTIYFAGDTAWYDGLEVAPVRLGRADLCLLPVGAYEPRWFMERCHMCPEEAVRLFEATARQNGQSTLLPLHHSTFVLSDEPADEPLRRTQEAWAAAGLEPERLAAGPPGTIVTLRLQPAELIGKEQLTA